MRKTLSKRIVEQIGSSPEFEELLEKYPELRQEIYRISESLVEASLGLSSKDTRVITNEALAQLEKKLQ